MATHETQLEQSEFYDDLVKSISEPEPMCVVIVTFEVSGYQKLIDFDEALEARVPDIVSASVKQRMSRDLRTYDLLSSIEQNSFVAALKTVVDEDDLADRLTNMELNLAKPYVFKELEATVDLRIGHAVRKPGETPAQLLRRADLCRVQANQISK